MNENNEQTNQNPNDQTGVQEGEKILSFPLPDDSHVMTFDLERANLRGRIIRMGRVLNDIFDPHDYPPIVADKLAETLTMAVLLSSMLKYDGIFILQIQGSGPITRLVADVSSDGKIRATAGYDADALNSLLAVKPANEMKMNELLQNGYLAFTVDQGSHTDRYQGIVELRGHSVRESIDHYFAQSEQIATALRLAVSKNTAGDTAGMWRAGAIMLQHVPDHADIPQDAKPIAENWLRAQILLETCRDDELLDPKLHDETLLYRLFHEEHVRIYPATPLSKACRCTTDKLRKILSLLSDDDRTHAMVDGAITMTCEFCNKQFSFTDVDLMTGEGAKEPDIS